MRFGSHALDEAEHAVLAHAVRWPGGSLPKGHRLEQDDVRRLREAGFSSVIAVKLDADDLGEDKAAGRLATALQGSHHEVTPACTGRVNVHATAGGLFTADRACVDRLNRIDPSITFACLESHVPVAAGEMIGTVKIIPLAVARAKVEAAEALLSGAAPFEVHPFRAHEVTLIATRLPSLKPSVMDKTARVLAQRLVPSGSRIVREIRCEHDAAAVSQAIDEALGAPSENPLVIIFGASALCDFDDVIPAAIRLSGGEVVQAGLPVDPGNLLVLGRAGGFPVIGAPGCARSPAENGFDWVLNRILAGLFPTPEQMTGFGVGGLLKEISARPSPRESIAAPVPDLVVSGLVLAAGRATRMGEGGHKLLAEFGGEPLARRSARIVAEGGIKPVAVVTGHRREAVEAALSGLDVSLVFNPDYASGMASSLVAGVVAPQIARADGVLVMLADMPGVTPQDVAALLAAFRAREGRSIVRAVSGGKRGNPVILPRATFAAIRRLEGDTGARAIVETCGLPVVDVDIGEAAHLDVDTPEAVAGAGGILKG